MNERDIILDQLSALLQQAKALATQHAIPFLAVYQPNGDWLSSWHHFPEEETSSELRAAWHEINGG